MRLPSKVLKVLSVLSCVWVLAVIRAHLEQGLGALGKHWFRCALCRTVSYGLGHHECLYWSGRGRSGLRSANLSSRYCRSINRHCNWSVCSHSSCLAFSHYTTAKGEAVYSDRALFAEEMVALLQRQTVGSTQENRMMAIQRSGPSF